MKKPSKKVIGKKAKAPKRVLDENHVLELMGQWQMPLKVIAQNQQVPLAKIKEVGDKLVKQKKLDKNLFLRLKQDSA